MQKEEYNFNCSKFVNVTYGMSGVVAAFIIAIFITCLCAQKKIAFLKKENYKHVCAKSLQATFEMECSRFIRDNLGPILRTQQEESIWMTERRKQEAQALLDQYVKIPRSSIEEEIKRLDNIRVNMSPRMQDFYNPLPAGYHLPKTPSQLETEEFEIKKEMLKDSKKTKKSGWTFFAGKKDRFNNDDGNLTITTTVSDTLKYISQLGSDM